MKKLILPGMLLCSFLTIFGQSRPDTVRHISLNEIQVSGTRNSIARLPQTEGGFIWAGKKNEVIHLQYADVNIAEKNPRQIFSKVPGIFVYDMDGSGNQMNISARGLDPHRGWEFNIRKNGIITNTDMYGYPASHFTLPMEAVERIELVRGTGALQYGQQFGGMLNYVLKQPDTTRTFGLESINSIGSYGLLSTYQGISGKVGKLSYYGYYSKRVSDGYRHNGRSDFNGQSIQLQYSPSEAMTLTAEFSHSEYLYHLPGQLTDSMFQENPRQSTRNRNYYSPDIYIPSVRLDWKLGQRTSLHATVSAVLGQRSSVLFNHPATIPDEIDPTTLAYAPRQVDIDRYHSYTSEWRLLHQYQIGKMASTLAAGIQVVRNDLHRRQQGVGTTGTDFDLTVAEDKWGRNMRFKTSNLAFFAENMIRITPDLTVSPGVRMEMGESKMSGVISYLPDDVIPHSIEHRFPLFGLNTEYRLGPLQNLYAGWSQAYRPVIFKDIVPASPYEKTDQDLEDAKGYTLEAGYRGVAGSFRWDIGAFRMQYNNRLGNQVIQEGNEFLVFRTNIGHSVTHGLEIFAEYAWRISHTLRASLFTSTSLMDAQYEDAVIRVGNENVDISGNEVESVPRWITRNGCTLRYKRISFTALYSYTSKTYADPLNTVEPSSTGAVGRVPAYGLLDLNATLRMSQNIMVRLNLSNVFDLQYFTKRPSFYPGPGIWPSDGRSGNVSVGVRF